MSRIIVLEGADASGKSTLAKKLVEAFNGEYVKFSQPVKPPYEEYLHFLLNHDQSKTYILDRFMYGELVYGPIFRGAAGFSMLDLNYLEMVLMRFNHIVIHCQVDLSHNLKKLSERGDDFVKLNQVEDIRLRYKAVFDHALIEQFIYDWTKTHDENFIGVIRGSLMYQESRRSSLIDQFPQGTYVGTSHPNYVFVGDEKNKRLKDRPVFDSTSGRYLLSVLIELGIAEQTALVNSLDKSHGRLTSYILNQLKAKRIICLGENAYSRISYGFKIRHPQYAKRFYGKNHRQLYLNEIKEAIS